MQLNIDNNESGREMTEIDKLIDGYKRFRGNYFESDEQLFEQLSQGQAPDTLVIACSDSRVDPAIIMDCKPGDLFVIRNVANLVPPYETGGGYHGVSSALEFGVRALNVKHIVVLGHQYCGGINALLNGVVGIEGTQFIQPWVNMAHAAREKVLTTMPDAPKQEQLCACEMESVLISLNNLLTFPWIKQRVDQGELMLHGWHFNIEKGILTAYDPAAAEFKPLV
jgi:carbonic anhydrase